MIFKILAICAVIHLSSGQGVTFKNGRVGVNFGGYEAEAGLGGLLTGNAADGGLGASAKTPFGQAAGAGLGGRVDGSAGTGGGLYAGATAGQGVGASAALGGDVGAGGASGGGIAQAQAGGVGKQVVKVGQASPGYSYVPAPAPVEAQSALVPAGGQVYTKTITAYVSPVSTSQTASRIDTSSDTKTTTTTTTATPAPVQTTTVQKVKTRKRPQTQTASARPSYALADRQGLDDEPYQYDGNYGDGTYYRGGNYLNNQQNSFDLRELPNGILNSFRNFVFGLGNQGSRDNQPLYTSY